MKRFKWRAHTGPKNPNSKPKLHFQIFYLRLFKHRINLGLSKFQPGDSTRCVSFNILSLTHTHKGTIHGVIGDRCKNTNQTGFQKVRTSGPLWDEDLRTVPETGFGNTVTYRRSLPGSSMAAITIGVRIYIMRSDRSWLADSVVFYFVCNSIPQERWEPSQVVLPESRVRMHFFRHISAIRNIFL